MMRHDEALLWEYAARELPAEDAKLVQHHLTECPECQEKLTDVRTARGALQAGRGQPLSLDYSKLDAVLAEVVEKKMANAVFGRPWVMALSGAFVIVGLALVGYGLWPRLMQRSTPFVAPAIALTAPVKTEPSVEKAAGLTVIGAQTRTVAAGTLLASGDVLRTTDKGEAVLKLPDQTRLKLTGGSELALTRAHTDDVTLSLERGHIAVAASHARRKGFVVMTNGLLVTVVGTTFSVSSSRDGVDIAVSEGRVSVEPPVGLPMFVSAGQRARFDSKWRSTRGAITAGEKRELNGLTETAVVAPPAGAKPHRAAVVELPPLPPVVEIEKPIEAIAPEPPAPPSKPDMTGLSVPLLASPVESVGTAPLSEKNQADQWAQMPQAAPAPSSGPPATPAPAPAAKLSEKSLAKDAEELALERAERSLSHGTCERYLVGLDEVARDPKRSERSELARIYRARCYDALMDAKATTLEYRRYLMEWPRGRFVDEARHVLRE